jgi:hypothetical protein
MFRADDGTPTPSCVRPCLSALGVEGAGGELTMISCAAAAALPTAFGPVALIRGRRKG